MLPISERPLLFERHPGSAVFLSGKRDMKMSAGYWWYDTDKGKQK